MPTYSSVGHALQFGTNTPTVTIVGTDTDGYIIYDMSTSGTFYQFAPNTQYFALQIIFDTPFIIPPGIILDPANTTTAEVLTAEPSVEFYVDQNDVTTSYFKISGISSSAPLLGAEVLMWAYQAGGQQVGMGSGGTVTSVATDSTLAGGPITTSGTLGINLAHANTWSAKQTFSNHIAIDGYTYNLSSGLLSGQVLAYDGANITPSNLQEVVNVNDLYLTGTGNTIVASVPTPTNRANYLVCVYYYIQPGANINFSVTLNWADLQNNQIVTQQTMAIVPSQSQAAGSYVVTPTYIYVTNQGSNPITVVANTNTANRVYISASIIRL